MNDKTDKDAKKTDLKPASPAAEAAKAPPPDLLADAPKTSVPQIPAADDPYPSQADADAMKAGTFSVARDMKAKGGRGYETR